MGNEGGSSGVAGSGTGGGGTGANSTEAGGGGGGAPAPAPAESRDQIMKTLKELGELKTAGILTDAEFDAKKKELLAKL